MTENQKTPTVQNNQEANQKQGNSNNQGSNNKQPDPSKKSPETEVEKESTEEVREQADVKHPHKQGVPVSVDGTKSST